MSKATSLNNLETVSQMVGTLQGISDGLGDERYLERVIKRAHGKATNAFDLAAASAGAAGHLQHVFEFGTIGVTPGQPKFNPTGQNARLWVHEIKGNGGRQDIGFHFRPALNRNPIPTTESTGVPSKYLRKISKRKYVFYNKAWVMESGQTVEIHAKRGNYLFVPFNNQPSRNPLNKRGFVMRNTSTQGPVVSTPGATTKGTFAAFWVRWWASQGQKTIESSMRISIGRSIKVAEAKMAKRVASESVKPAATVKIKTQAHSTRAATRREMERTPIE